MRRSCMLVLATVMTAALSLAVAAPAAAKPPLTGDGSIISAIGSTSLEADGSLVFMGIEIYTDGVNGQAHVSRATYAVDPSEPEPILLTEEYGTVNLDPGNLVVAADLSSLVLLPVAADLWDCGDDGCVPTETVTVAATFTATGPVNTTVERFWERSKDCRTRATTTYEDVVTTMSLDFDGVATSWDEAGLQRQSWKTRTWGCEG